MNQLCANWQINGLHNVSKILSLNFLYIYTFHQVFIYNKLKCIYLFDIGSKNISASIDGSEVGRTTTYRMFQTPSNNDIVVGREMHIKCCQLPHINGHSGGKEMHLKSFKLQASMDLLVEKEIHKVWL